MTQNSNDPLGPGVWGVLATPFLGSTFEIDEPSLIREVELYRKVGAAGLTVLGVFGEAASLTGDEQREVVEIVADSAGDLPVVVGLPALATAPAIEQGTRAREAAGRLAGLMVQVNTPVPGLLARHLGAVHEATATGIVVQDYPVASGVRIPTDALAEAVAACPFVVAVKSEAPPTSAAIAGLTARLDVPVFGGLGGVGLLDELAAGAAGAMTGFSHPEGLVDTLAAWRDGGYPAAREAFAPWLPLVNFEAQAGIGLAIRKESLRQRGVIIEAGVRPPASTMPEALLTMLKQHLDAVPRREALA